MSPLVKRLGPLFKYTEYRKKYRIVPFPGMRGDSEFINCYRWNSETGQYEPLVGHKVKIREGDIYDSIGIGDEATGKIVYLMALQMSDVVCTVKEKTFHSIKANEPTENFWFHIQEI